MSLEDDLSTLPNRMRYAAFVMDEAKIRLNNEIYAQPQPVSDSTWSSAALRSRADIWERHDHQFAEIEALAGVVAKARGYIASFESLDPIDQRECRSLATQIIASGWRKEPRQ